MGAFTDADKIYINGICCGSSYDRYASRIYPVAPGILRAGENCGLHTSVCIPWQRRSNARKCQSHALMLWRRHPTERPWKPLLPNTKYLSTMARMSSTGRRCQKYLSKETYKALTHAIDNGTPIDREIANHVAAGMRMWALAKRSHSLYPLVSTAYRWHRREARRFRGTRW